MVDSPPAIVLPDQFNAATAFLERNLAEGRGAKTAIYYEGQSYSYAQIAELANRVGNGLLDLGLDMEQRVALLLLDSPQLAASFFGAIKIGAVPIPLNTLLRPHDYLYMLNDSRARVLLVHAALWPQVQPILSQLKYLRHVVSGGSGAGWHCQQQLPCTISSNGWAKQRRPWRHARRAKMIVPSGSIAPAAQVSPKAVSTFSTT